MTESYKTTAIVIGVVDYKEKDKLVTLFSLELGLITASLKGVKSSNAKLKYASQPFCFGEFELIKNGTKFTCTAVSVIDQFYELTTNYDHFVLASQILKILPIVLKDNSIVNELFLTTIKLLKTLTYEKIDGRICLIKFLLQSFKFSGYELNLETCSNCGKSFTQDSYLDINLGNFVCSRCASITSKLLPKGVFQSLKEMESCPEDSLSSVTCKESVKVLNVLISTFYYLYGVKLTDLVTYLTNETKR